jgi:hypothetical protein
MGVILGLGAQTMVHVGHVYIQRPLVGQLGQQMEQADAVCAAGDADHHGRFAPLCPPRKEDVALLGASDLIEQGGR